MAFESKSSVASATLAPPVSEPERSPRPASLIADADSGIPRLESFRFHSAILPEPDDRAVLVYLPREYYDAPDRSFPVFYLHDGQNLFDETTAYIPGHPWFAHTTADRMAEEGLAEPIILVGIANTGLRRMAEYTPTRDPKLGGGEGELYGKLLLEELKPLIDSNFRTLPDPAHTALGGSSLGGLISLFLGFEHAEVFGKIAALSPSLWWDHRSLLNRIETDLRSHPRPNLQIWLDMGTEEGARHVRDTELLVRLLERHGWRPQADFAYLRASGATHSEDSWAARFDQVLQFLFPAR